MFVLAGVGKAEVRAPAFTWVHLRCPPLAVAYPRAMQKRQWVRAVTHRPLVFYRVPMSPQPIPFETGPCSAGPATLSASGLLSLGWAGWVPLGAPGPPYTVLPLS